MKLDTKPASASMDELRKTLDSMQEKTRKFMQDAMGFSASLKSEIATSALALTQEISSIIQRAQENIEESRSNVVEGTAMLEQIERKGKMMRGNI